MENVFTPDSDEQLVKWPLSLTVVFPPATMPSDLAKKKAVKKKEAAKARQRTKKPDEMSEESEQTENQENGAETNGERKKVCLSFK